PPGGARPGHQSSQSDASTPVSDRGPLARPRHRAEGRRGPLGLQRFLEACMGFRAVSRVLTLLALALGIKKALCPQTLINWVIRLSIVRLDAARTLRGFSLSQAPFTNGLIWRIDISIGLGSGKIVAVLALAAPHHQLAPGAPALRHIPCIGVAV